MPKLTLAYISSTELLSSQGVSIIKRFEGRVSPPKDSHLIETELASTLIASYPIRLAVTATISTTS
jgi:hypothetical protein